MGNTITRNGSNGVDR